MPWLAKDAGLAIGLAERVVPRREGQSLGTAKVGVVEMRMAAFKISSRPADAAMSDIKVGWSVEK